MVSVVDELDQLGKMIRGFISKLDQDLAKN